MNLRPHLRAGQLRQSGFFLLSGLFVVVIAASYLLVSRLNAAGDQIYRDEQTALALAQAKEALIGYASTYPDNIDPNSGPGYLPCPDPNDTGSPNGNCSIASNTVVGRFPWKYLGLRDLRDGSGERLWYAISEDFRYGPNKLVPLNSGTPTPNQLTVDNAGDIVAIVFAPGVAFERNTDPAIPCPRQQSRPSNDVRDYLENSNNDGDTSFITATAPECFNDRLITVTRQELMAAVEKRVLGEVRQALQTYYDNSHSDAAYRFYPYGAVLGLAGPPPPPPPPGLPGVNQVGQEGLRRGYLPVTLPTNPPEVCTCTYDGSDILCTCNGQGTYRFESPGNITSVSGTGFVMTSDFCTYTGPTASGTCSIGGASFNSVHSTIINNAPGCAGAGTNICTCTTAGGQCTTGTSTHANPTLIALPPWFILNGWQEVIYYTLADSCSAKNLGCDGTPPSFLSVGANVSVEAVLIAAGQAIATPVKGGLQLRTPPSPDVVDYLDSVENTDGNERYDASSVNLSSIYNDQTKIVSP